MAAVAAAATAVAATQSTGMAASARCSVCASTAAAVAAAAAATAATTGRRPTAKIRPRAAAVAWHPRSTGCLQETVRARGAASRGSTLCAARYRTTRHFDARGRPAPGPRTCVCPVVPYYAVTRKRVRFLCVQSSTQPHQHSDSTAHCPVPTWAYGGALPGVGGVAPPQDEASQLLAGSACSASTRRCMKNSHAAPRTRAQLVTP